MRGELDVERRNDDSLWKGLIEYFFYTMLEVAIPSLFEDADREVAPTFLDKELKRLSRFVPEKARFVDLLVKVPLKSGLDAWVLLHIEVRAPRACVTYKRKRLYGMPLLKQEVTRKSMPHLCCEGW